MVVPDARGLTRPSSSRRRRRSRPPEAPLGAAEVVAEIDHAVGELDEGLQRLSYDGSPRHSWRASSIPATGTGLPGRVLRFTRLASAISAVAPELRDAAMHHTTVRRRLELLGIETRGQVLRARDAVATGDPARVESLRHGANSVGRAVRALQGAAARMPMGDRDLARTVGSLGDRLQEVSDASVEIGEQVLPSTMGPVRRVG